MKRTTRKPRSVRMTLTSSVLAFEAFVAFFATLVILGLHAASWPSSLILIGGLLLTCGTLGAAAIVARPGGIGLGWVLQGVFFACGFLQAEMFFVAPLFAALWGYAVVVGEKIDRQKALAKS